MEIIKAISMLCAIYGTNSNIGIVQWEQIQCHAYYAQCMKDKKKFYDCMIERPKVQK